MKLKNEFEPIREWATEKGIYDKSDAEKQYEKLDEEVHELFTAILKKDKNEIADAIGDCVVCLVNVAHLSGLPFEECVNDAYKVISERTGKMVNGVFVKN